MGPRLVSRVLTAVGDLSAPGLQVGSQCSAGEHFTRGVVSPDRQPEKPGTPSLLALTQSPLLDSEANEVE